MSSISNNECSAVTESSTSTTEGSGNMLGEGLERREELADGEENCEMLTSGHSMADARSTCGAHTRSN